MLLPTLGWDVAALGTMVAWLLGTTACPMKRQFSSQFRWGERIRKRFLSRDCLQSSVC